MEFSEYLSALRREGDLLADAAAEAGPQAEVPTCPGWRVRDLLQHVGVVHRWAAANVSAADGRRVGLKEIISGSDAVPGDQELVPWLRAGHAALLDALGAAQPGLACWTFIETEDPLGFWARRQAHETAIHRADAVFSCTVPVLPPYDAAFAADGVAEIFDTLLPRRRVRADQAGARLSDRERSLEVRATDTGSRWWARVTPDDLEVGVGGGGDLVAQCTVSGPAEELYLALWNRADVGGLAVDGDRDVLRWWRERVRI